MTKKKTKPMSLETKIRTMIHPRYINRRDRLIFEKKYRRTNCLFFCAQHLIDITKLDHVQIRNELGSHCESIEAQFGALRYLTCLTKTDYIRRYKFTRCLLDCLFEHHNTIYEGILFGSTVNGLGFRDSDVDLRLRPMMKISNHMLEPVVYDSDMVERTLRNIAYQTTRCSPALGGYVPSSKCPLAKLSFLSGDPKNPSTLREGLNYDISLSAANSLGSYNSIYLRFLCHLEPKFHILATILRYWSKVHNLIIPGYLSSYALVNMLIFFCQTTKPPLLPTVDEMREVYLEQQHDRDPRQAITQAEWYCLASFDKDMYRRSNNKEPLCVLLLKFFELYLTFPYSDHIITTRPGCALLREVFKVSPQYHPRFPIRDFMNIQDPFDLKHNLTSGMVGGNFQKFMIVMRYSYEKLYNELMFNFKRPTVDPRSGTSKKPKNLLNDGKKTIDKSDPRNWGLNVILTELTEQELREAM